MCFLVGQLLRPAEPTWGELPDDAGPPSTAPRPATASLRRCRLLAQCCSKLGRPQHVTLHTCTQQRVSNGPASISTTACPLQSFLD